MNSDYMYVKCQIQDILDIIKTELFEHDGLEALNYAAMNCYAEGLDKRKMNEVMGEFFDLACGEAIKESLYQYTRY